MPAEKKRRPSKQRTKAVNKKQTKGKKKTTLKKIVRAYGKYTTLTPEGRKAFLKTVKELL
jgi:hypothetical protein